MTNRNSSSKPAQQHRDPYDPSPTLTDNALPALSPVVVLEFATPEAQASVLGPLREKYDNAAAFAGAEWQQAAQCQAEMDTWVQEIEDAKRVRAEADQRIADRQGWIESRAGDQRRHMVHGQQGCDVANPLAVLLGVAGVKVNALQAPAFEATLFPPVSPSVDRKVHPLDMSQPLTHGDPQGHASVFGGPSQGSFPETEPDGFCIHCGAVCWRTAVSDVTPKGAKHSYGATCNPDNPESTVADLGEVVVGAERAAS